MNNVVNDPRLANARLHSEEGGLITGVFLTWEPVQDALYKCTLAQLVNEVSANGQTICRVSVFDEAASPTVANVGLLLGYTSKGNGIMRDANEFLGIDTNIKSGTAVEHVITNKFEPPNQSGLAVAIVADGKVISDVVSGMGLPWGHHVSFSLIFRRKKQDEMVNTGQGDPPKAQRTVGEAIRRIAELRLQKEEIQIEIDQLLKEISL